MTYYICSWCKPPKVFQAIDDGQPETLTTHGMCDSCFERVTAENAILGDEEPPGAGRDVDTAAESEGERMEKARRKKEGA